MKTVITKYLTISTLLFLGLSSTAIADATLPVSKQATDNKTTTLPQSKQKSSGNKEDKIEIVPEIKIQAEAPTKASNSKLKDGKVCDFENLEEAKGEIFTEIPMAETIPCDKVDCSDLKAAKMLKDNYKKLPDAKTVACDK